MHLVYVCICVWCRELRVCKAEEENRDRLVQMDKRYCDAESVLLQDCVVHCCVLTTCY